MIIGVSMISECLTLSEAQPSACYVYQPQAVMSDQSDSGYAAVRLLRGKIIQQIEFTQVILFSDYNLEICISFHDFFLIWENQATSSTFRETLRQLPFRRESPRCNIPQLQGGSVCMCAHTYEKVMQSTQFTAGKPHLMLSLLIHS